MLIQTPLVNGELPGDRAHYRRTRHIGGGIYAGQYSGPVQAEHSPYVKPQLYREEITREELVEMFAFKQRAEVLERIALTPAHQATFDAMEYGAFKITLPRVGNLLDDLKVLNGGPIPNPKIEAVKKGVPL